MALVVGDVHGRIDKVELFLAHKPEEKHIFTGDYVDSFVQSDRIIYQTLKCVLESNAILIIGNHDIHYLTNPPFMCGGYRQHMAESINKILESFITRFMPVALEDGFIITHAGISKGLALNSLRTTEPNDICKIINHDWEIFLGTRHMKSGNRASIFNIPESRGGTDVFGGIFWADYRDEEYIDIPQVFGHSKTPSGVLQVNPDHWAVGCDDYKFECFNTATKEVEGFGIDTRGTA